MGLGCDYLHGWSTVPELVLKSSLRRHKRELKGISFHRDWGLLYSASCDGCLCRWDCSNYHLQHAQDLNSEIGSLLGAGKWVFVGVRNSIQIYDIEKSMDFKLQVHGLVTALSFANGTLFAGTNAGQIVSWRVRSGRYIDSPFRRTHIFSGVHDGEVTSLAMGNNNFLYSGSVDQTVKTWDLNAQACINSWEAHNDTITSLSFHPPYLISTSLDGRIIAANVNSGVSTGRLKSDCIYATRMYDTTNQRILACSSGNGVTIYDFPTFANRAKFFSEATVVAFAPGPNGDIVTGDRNGNLHAWSLTR